MYKKYFTWIDIVLIINICCSIFLLNKRIIEKCNLYTEYYKQKKQIKEMQKKLYLFEARSSRAFLFDEISKV